MIKRLLILTLSIGLFAPATFAQDAPEEPVPPGWRTGVIAKLAGSQVGFSNWQGGGINSLAFTAGIEGEAKNESETWKQTAVLRLGIGAIKQDTLSVRKAEDVIFAGYNLQLKGEGFFAKWTPTFDVTVRTQFIEGFDYGTQPETKVSDFLSPAYVTESLGLTRTVGDWFSQRFGLASKQTVVTKEELRPLYGFVDDELDKTARVEVGFESQTQVKLEVAKNVTYKSTLLLFDSFNAPETPDALWENLVTMKVNDWLQTNFELVLLYDDDVSSDVQLKEVFSVGVAFTLL